MRLLTLFLTCVLSMGIHAQDSTIKQKLEEIDNAIAHYRGPEQFCHCPADSGKI